MNEPDEIDTPSLSIRERLFCDAVIAGASLTDAARGGGWTGAPETLHATASRIAQRPHVAREIERRRAWLALSGVADQLEIAAALSDIARGEIGPLVGIDANDLHQLPPRIRRTIKKMTVVERTSAVDGSTSRRTEMELHDPIKAAAQLCRMMGWHAPERLAIEHGSDQGGDAREWREGLSDSELAAWGVAVSAGDHDSAARWQQVGARRVREAVARLLEQRKGTR